MTSVESRESSPIALVFGAHLNGHSIVRSLRVNGVPIEDIYIAKLAGTPSLSAEFFNRAVASWTFDIERAEDLPGAIRRRFGSERTKVLFFTDERYLPALNRASLSGEVPDLRFFVGSSKHLDAILDRFLFYRFIEGCFDKPPVPATLPGDVDPVASFGGSFVIRPRISWHSVRSRFKVHIVTSPREFDKVVADYAAGGLTPEDWCTQELLSMNARHNVSVCGWYDGDHQEIFCTRKVLQHPPHCGNGDVIELLSDPPAPIVEQTLTLLQALQFEGPFELEWVFDRNSGSYKIIELNPRFWMQHSLVDALCGWGLVGRYLGKPALALQSPYPRCPLRYWVNPLYALYRLFRRDSRGLRYYMSSVSMSPISLLQSLIYAPFHFVGKGMI